MPIYLNYNGSSADGTIAFYYGGTFRVDASFLDPVGVTLELGGMPAWLQYNRTELTFELVFDFGCTATNYDYGRFSECARAYITGSCDGSTIAINDTTGTWGACDTSTSLLDGAMWEGGPPEPFVITARGQLVGFMPCTNSYTPYHQGGATYSPPEPGVPSSFGFTPETPTRKAGCLLCSLASMLTSFGLPVTPANLDQALADADAYDDSNGIILGKEFENAVSGWATISVKPYGRSAVLDPATQYNEFLAEHLCSKGERVILQLAEWVDGVRKLSSSGKPAFHYVFVAGHVTGRDWAGPDWYVFDPGWKYATPQENLLTLSGHVSGFFTANSADITGYNVRYFEVAGFRTFRLGRDSSMRAAIACPSELLMIDPVGRAIGFDPASQSSVFEVPGATYCVDGPIVDAETNGPSIGDPDVTKTIYVPSPLAGVYQIVATGTGSGAYTIHVETSYTNGIGQSTNFSGVASAGLVSSYAVGVLPPPAITMQPISQSVLVGSNVTFVARASGASPLGTGWQFYGTNVSEGRRISGSHTVALSINSAQPSDQGSYDMFVTNAYGSVTSAVATLTVTTKPTPPAIISQPAAEAIATGGTATYVVSATGTSPLLYQWQCNSTNLTDDNRIVGSTSSILSVSNVTQYDAGAYGVIVSNSAGAVTSTTALLIVNVNGQAPSISTQPFSESVALGSNATFSITALGTQPLQYQWQLNSTNVSDGIGISGATNSTLILSAVVGSQAGSYSVILSNAAGLAHSDGALLAVGSAPWITIQPLSQTVVAGSMLRLMVNASGTPPLAYQWMKNGGDLTDVGEISGSTSNNLTLNPTMLGDAGTYSVIITNAFGSVTSTPSLVMVALNSIATLYSFSAGWYPVAGLTLSGNTLYGTSSGGGNSGNGTVFALKTDGSGFATLYSFSATDTNGFNTDGAKPRGGLILCGNTLFGTASQGGTSGNGTVFSVSTDGTGFQALHAFTGGSDGADPLGCLLLSGSALYGTASEGGASGWGTVFCLSTNGASFQALYAFTGGSDGSGPAVGLILSSNTLYGAASGGGDTLDNGTVFSLNTNGVIFQALYAFSGGSDGSGPAAGLISSGKTLYGTASGGGGGSGNGTVFSLNSDGTGFKSLRAFSGGSDGAQPVAALILLGNKLYGTASSGGSFGEGTVFSLNTDGTGFNTLHAFTGGSDGAEPEACLISSGKTLYGTASSGGNLGGGAVFALSLGGSSPVPIALEIRSGNESVVLSWNDPSAAFSLQAASTVTGVFTNVPGATSPFTNVITGSAQFFRLMAAP